MNENAKELAEIVGNPQLKAIEAEGITPEYLASKLKAELEALETKVFQHKGNIVVKDDLIAWEIRQKARQDAHKLRGDYPVERKHHTFEGGIPIVPLTEEQERTLEAMKRLLEQDLDTPEGGVGAV